MKSLQIQIRREFWEHRRLWLVPLLVAAALLAAAALFGHTQLVHLDLDSRAADPARTPQPAFELLQLGWGMAFYVTAAILASIYFLDCLYSERRDRSILFWKSLPVSDMQTVLVKFLVGLVIVPLAIFVLAALTSVLASGLLELRARAVMHSNAALWDTLTWLRLQGLMLYALLAALCWYAPYGAYLMLASAAARRSPYLWAVIPPILLRIFDGFFGTHYLHLLMGRGFGELMHRAFHGSGKWSSDSPDPVGLLMSSQLWLGLAAAALMLALAIRLRRYRDDS
jgi:ABC-2 type transport system permease protein